MELTQPQLIDSVLMDLGLLNKDGTEKKATMSKTMPAMSTKILGPDPKGPDFQYDWDYRSVVGKLNFLEKSTRPDIAFATNQCSRFMAQPKQSHGEAVKRIGRYLLGSRGKGLILRPDQSRLLECYVDASFCGDWEPENARDDPVTARSRHGFVIKLAGTPLYWSTKLQTQVALSTTESEYIGLSAAARYVKGTLYLLKEL